MLLLGREMDEESVLTAAGTGGFFRAAAGCVVRRGASGRGSTLLLSIVSTDFGALPPLVASSTCSIKGDVGGWITTVCSRIPLMHRPECLEQENVRRFPKSKSYTRGRRQKDSHPYCDFVGRRPSSLVSDT